MLMASIVFVLGSCSTETDERGTRIASDTTVSAAAKKQDSLVIELTGVDSASVLDLLKATHRVEHQSSAMGVFVKTIDSIRNASGVYWLYSVNDSMANIACDRYITKDGDRIKWHFRRMGR